MEETATVEQPAVEQQVVPSILPVDTVQTDPTPVKDLATRVSEFKKVQTQKPAQSNVEVGFDFKEIESIKDPVAKEIAMRAYKSMESGVQKKFQDLAAQRRDYEQKLSEMQNWSPERIERELLNNPQFLQAAQQIARTQNPANSGLTDEQFSALTPSEKSELAQVPTLKNKINQLEQVNYQAVVSQYDSRLQTKYTDYNPSEIDAYIEKLSKMSPVEIREHAYKSLKHDENVGAAFEVGRQEAMGLNQQKIKAITPMGNSVIDSNDVPVREKNDTDQMYFMKLANHRLAQFKNRK